MSRIGVSRKILAFLLALTIPVAGLTFTAFADPGTDDLVSRAYLTKLRDGVSEWSETYAHDGISSIHLKAPDKATKSEEVNEGRIVLKLVNGTTLEDIESIEWWVRTVSGYPPHVDLILDLDKDGVSDNTLVAEFAYQPYVGPNYHYQSPGVPYGHYDPGLGATYYNPTYNTWVRTFQNNTAELKSKNVTDDTIFWLSSGLSGPYSGGYFGKLEDFKDGDVKVIGGTTLAPVNEKTVVLEIQIEIDNWLGSSEAYVDQVFLNEEPLINELQPPVIEVIKPEHKAYNHINIPVKISTYDLFGVSGVWFNVKKGGGGWFYPTNRTYTQPTVMHYLPVGDYTFYAWAENELGVMGENSTITFSVIVSALSVDLKPNTLNIRSMGRWVTVFITPPSGRTAEEIDIESLKLRVGDKSVNASWGRVQDGVLMVKFSREDLQRIVGPGEKVEVKLTGAYDDGTAFEGEDTMRVINPGKRGFMLFNKPSKSGNKGQGKTNRNENKYENTWNNQSQKGNKGK